MCVPAHTCTQKMSKNIPKLYYNKNLKSAVLSNTKFLFLCLTHLILFSILSTTIFIQLKTWLSSGTTCSFKVWMFHSRPSAAWKRIWLQNLGMSISLQPSPIMKDILSHQLKQFPGKIWLLPSFASSWLSFFPYHDLKNVFIFPLPLFSKMDTFRQQIPPRCGWSQDI